MTTLARPASLATVSVAMVRAMVDYVVDKHYTCDSGVLGIRGRPSTGSGSGSTGSGTGSTGPGDAEPEVLTTDGEGRSVRVVYCPSALAAREVMLQRIPGSWLVIVTDREDADLGVGVLAHLIGQQLRTPDPWDAVLQRFRATTIDARLTGPGHREIAYGLLESMPLDGWPAAPAGMLTRDHAFGCVVQGVLGLTSGAVDLVSVLGWTTQPGITSRWAELREQGGDPLADAVAAWVAASCGQAGPVVAALLAGGRVADLCALGLVVDLLQQPTVDPTEAKVALAHLAHHWGGRAAVGLEPAIRVVGPHAATVVATLLTDPRTRADAERVIAQADGLAREAGAEGLAEVSPLLRSGLTRRFHRLADLLRSDPIRQLHAVEESFDVLSGHVLASADPRRPAFLAAVRLVRWLAGEAGAAAVGVDLGALARRQVEVDGWVDAALNDAAAGVDDAELGAGLAHVLELTRQVRDAHDLAFAHALAQATADEAGAAAGYLEHAGGRVYLLERVLPDLVLPLASRTPTLLLVLDGLSTGVATEVLDDLLRPSSGWEEQLPDGSGRRAAGLAVLPTVTEVSRASLLSGTLTTGQQDVERRGFGALTSAYGIAAVLFHKKILDSTRLGYSLSDDVRAAIDDVYGLPLVAGVLNTIDDALDRSDPAGTTWTADAVKHLRPLMERARDAGRTVVISSDHGHIVERRLSDQRSYPGGGPARHRAAQGEVGADEVLVGGPRVQMHGGQAVLAVSERLRYGPLKAGYHGGAAPAEAVVPVVILVPSERAQEEGLRLAPPQEPRWWFNRSSEPVAPPASPLWTTPGLKVTAPKATVPTLFDTPADAPAGARAAGSLGRRLVESTVYEEQRRIAGRIAITDDQVATAVDELARSAQRRLSARQLAVALDLAPARVRGAVEQLSRILNVEGYPVIVRDVATGAVILDEVLAREQFGLAP